jgi:NADPH:quinone reductase-like Zn-dependent oxidoreductase
MKTISETRTTPGAGTGLRAFSGPTGDEKEKSMRAVVYDRYGPPEVQRLEEVERPVPKEDEVLVKIHATTVNRTDCGLRSAEPFITRFFTGLRRPKRRILGMELAGEVEAVGEAVSEFKVGDQVFGVKGSGAHAEFVCIRESAPLAHKPAGLSFEEAAAVCDGACSALSCLRRADLRKERSILVYGASGSIGTAAVQLAKYFAAEVTAVCNTKNVELVRSLGADEVVDYLQDDFTKNGKTYDVIFDAVGKHSFRRCRRSLKPGGMFIETDPGFMWHALALALLTRWIGDKRVVMGIARYTKKDVLFLKGLIEAGKYRAVIDRTYPLEEVVAATRYVETGQKTGNLVLTVDTNAAR